MKLRRHHSFLLCLVALLSCGANATRHGTDSANGESSEQSADLQEQKYTDLAIFDLKGPVKSVSTQTTCEGQDESLDYDMAFGFGMNDHSFSFEKDGLWKKDNTSITIFGSSTNFSISRNHKGDIKKLTSKDGYMKVSFSFEFENGKVEEMDYELDYDAEGTTESTTSFTYKDGKVVAMTYKEKNCEGMCSYTDCKVTVKDETFDNYGNWTKRVLLISGKRYEDSMNDDGSYENEMPLETTLVQTRTISYW